ncbi:MAG: di-trans,poly-cis-decaprenylcistransferase, partial [Eggerthellaceae bacterium]|nr:di-trans,poly-cis-decaprenylcistransferase [Eggerthellaceae bacterium]
MLHKPVSEIFPQIPSDINISEFDETNIPRHVGIIMDGNGRWAQKRLLNRLKGHAAGVAAVRESIRAASDCGVEFLTIYSFSTENWKRPKAEVAGLMDLLANTMLAELHDLFEEGIRVKAIGDLSILPDKTRDAFNHAWDVTKNNHGMTIFIAINYGSRQEILHATQEYARIYAQAYKENAFMQELTEEVFSKYLYTAGAPDVDLVIRTSGEYRISNFLLWQIAYAELYITDVLWPDF